MLSLGDRVLFRDSTNPTLVRVGRITEINNGAVMPYVVTVSSKHTIRCKQHELTHTNKLFAKAMVIGPHIQGYLELIRDIAVAVVPNAPDQLGASVDLVVFTGGADITPYMYKQEPHERTFFDVKRDAAEAALYREAKRKGIKCVGICRGGQLLNVLNGGRMVQHINGHTSKHMMHTSCGNKFEVSSTHHQLMDPTDEGELLGWSEQRSTEYLGLPDYQPCLKDNETIEPEVIWYKKTGDLCVQYHPEMMAEDTLGRKYFNDICKDLKES